MLRRVTKIKGFIAQINIIWFASNKEWKRSVSWYRRKTSHLWIQDTQIWMEWYCIKLNSTKVYVICLHLLYQFPTVYPIVCTLPMHSAERCISPHFFSSTLLNIPLSLETCNPPLPTPAPLDTTHHGKIPVSMMTYWNQGD